MYIYMCVFVYAHTATHKHTHTHTRTRTHCPFSIYKLLLCFLFCLTPLFFSLSHTQSHTHTNTHVTGKIYSVEYDPRIGFGLGNAIVFGKTILTLFASVEGTHGIETCAGVSGDDCSRQGYYLFYVCVCVCVCVRVRVCGVYVLVCACMCVCVCVCWVFKR